MHSWRWAPSMACTSVPLSESHTLIVCFQSCPLACDEDEVGRSACDVTTTLSSQDHVHLEPLLQATRVARPPGPEPPSPRCVLLLLLLLLLALGVVLHRDLDDDVL